MEQIWQKWYRNRRTDERTEDRAAAMKWYRSGDQVEVWKNGRMILALLM